jgi:transcription elongation factor GreB
MSKAFTREDDSGDALIPKPVSVLPPGARNYLTPRGAQKLRDELSRLVDVERPSLLTATTGEGATAAEAKEQLQRVDHRIAYLQQSLQTADVSAAPPPPHDVVRFGATVRVRDQKGVETRYRIVGVDETDFDRNEVSWLSPIARALLNARLGQKVEFKFPAGKSTLEIVEIGYEG